MEKQINYLQMIQGIINRMSTNSFALKGWAVTLVAGFFTLASKDTDKMYFLISYVPIILFWGLDSYYLQQERLYCALYDRTRTICEGNQLDFSLSATRKEFTDKKCSYLNCLISPTEIWFYVPLAFLCSVIIVLTQF